ncbi:leptin receptor gene-related protein [Harmonia axyridis]|uniref:leptin receptor gene-related protein n=1 Tax=Harmonia axyridis TaxID=115357 RepID=UPI001E275EC0|nr:leptin receptor gene-related protein [Harmonia axyridis]
MAGIKTLVALAFTGSLGMTLVILACALNAYSSWYPFLVILFYVLSPIPLMVARRYPDVSSSSNIGMENAVFLTMGAVVSAFALPIVLSRVPIIQWGACCLTLSGNVVVYEKLEEMARCKKISLR